MFKFPLTLSQDRSDQILALSCSNMQIYRTAVASVHFEGGLLEYQDHHENTEASGRDQEASERDQEASERDQNEMENNNKKFSSRDQNDENACATNTHHDKHTRKKEKQMTYREALLGLDNSELGSDFLI